MKNQYVGDIGDYGKYGLLRYLAKRGIKIGVNWYLTKNDGSSDGKFTEYLKHDVERVFDPDLFDALQDVAFQSDKTVHMVEENGIIPEAVFFSEVLKSSKLEVSSRELNRRLWFNNSTLLLNDAELIFADPDNGISFRKNVKVKDSEKFVLPEEVSEYYNSGKNVVYYCHKGRRKPEEWEQAKIEIRKYITDAQILGVTFHRGTQRSYIFVLHPNSYRRYEEVLSDFLETEWGRLFTWEYARGNAISGPNPFEASSRVTLEPLETPFSVCKVTDYTQVDLEKPFVFTGTTDTEKSLVCPTEIVPENTVAREDGWRAFRICGELDFSLIGILAGITKVLADEKISVFAISTFNTDYVLVKENDFESAIAALRSASMKIKHPNGMFRFEKRVKDTGVE